MPPGKPKKKRLKFLRAASGKDEQHDATTTGPCDSSDDDDDDDNAWRRRARRRWRAALTKIRLLSPASLGEFAKRQRELEQQKEDPPGRYETVITLPAFRYKVELPGRKVGDAVGERQYTLRHVSLQQCHAEYAPSECGPRA